MPTDTADELVPNPQVRRELGGQSEMTTWRWDHNPKMATLGWPPAVRINGRKFRSRQALNKFREACVLCAIAERDMAFEQQAEKPAKPAEQPTEAA
jgi:hypothetical protein